MEMADAMQWDKVMGKKVRSIDGEDIGKVENVNTDSIEVKDGLIAKRHYYIPKDSIQGFDGDDNLITTMTKKDIHEKFSADNPVADLWKAPKE
jgi:sporulation protein YlmC with PRC-barrel domain